MFSWISYWIFYGHIPIEISSSPHAPGNCPGLAPIPKLFGQETCRLFQKPPWATTKMGRPFGENGENLRKNLGKPWEMGKKCGKWLENGKKSAGKNWEHVGQKYDKMMK